MNLLVYNYTDLAKSSAVRTDQLGDFPHILRFVKDYPVEKYYRDVKLLTIGEGTSEIQRIVIARDLLK
jgi:hypothetical protein